MKLGLRTVKTAVSAMVAMIAAGWLGLLYTPSAGIIAVLSVTNTKKTSWQTGLSRLAALTVATLISGLCFRVLGYTPYAFGVYLLLFIPVAVRLGLSEGIVVSSVLVTHYLVERTMSWELIANEYALMMLGVGCALIANLYMPDLEVKLKEDQEVIETLFRKLLFDMAAFLNQSASERNLLAGCQQLLTVVRDGEKRALVYQENQLFSRDLYYSDYFSMRRSQTRVLDEMIRSLDRIVVDDEHVENIRELLAYTAAAFSEDNDGQDILDNIYEVYELYRAMPLPATREEFENRAELFQFLQSFKSFIEIKAEFAALRQEEA